MNETSTTTMSQQEREGSESDKEWIDLVDEIIEEDREILDRLA
jgi:hypothetical protein